MWYLFSQTVLFSIMMSATAGLGEVRSPLSIAAECAALATINAVGVLLCFEANRRGDNREFLNRFVCLGWPLMIRLLVLFIPVAVAAMVVVASIEDPLVARTHLTGMRTAQFGNNGSQRIELAGMVVGYALNIGYYWRLRSHLQWVAAAPAP
jgi:hypothetical protein